VLTDADRDRAIAAGDAHELLDGSAGAVLGEPGDREGCEHDVVVGLHGLPLVVVDRAGSQVVLGIRNDFSSCQSRW